MTERDLFAAYSCPYDAPAYEMGEREPVRERTLDVAGSGSVMVEYHARRPSLRPLPVAAGALRVRKVVASYGP
jgi:hypothetical protein